MKFVYASNESWRFLIGDCVDYLQNDLGEVGRQKRHKHLCPGILETKYGAAEQVQYGNRDSKSSQRS